MSGDRNRIFRRRDFRGIITGLSKLRWFFVIAHDSSFAYKGKAVDVKRAARELGVFFTYFMGSVRKGGDRVRITAQLIDAATGNRIRADRYDGELTDVFALQDEITRRCSAIEPKRCWRPRAFARKSGRPKTLTTGTMVIQANSLFWRLTPADGDAAVTIMRRAVERYPDYGPAHSMLALCFCHHNLLGGREKRH